MGRRRGRRNRTDWRTIIRRIRAGKFTPIISDRIFFPGANTLRQSWAEELDYPYPYDHGLSIAKLAQFLSATSRDDLAAKEDFLDFSKQYLIDTVRDQVEGDSSFLDRVEDEIYDITFSDVAERLSFPRYDDELENPLIILASLPLPIYITTSYYNFLERYLTEVGKSPRTELCYWNESMTDIPSVFEEDPDYQPSEEEPLVYHLHGLDSHPASLVLTEDDYLDFLVKVSEDLESIPRRVAQAMVDSSLLLLGYQLDDWNFKVMFRGLVNSKRSSRRRMSLSIQYTPDDENDVLDPQEVQDYLIKYFDQANFDIYWGDPVTFTQELWEHWEAG